MAKTTRACIYIIGMERKCAFFRIFAHKMYRLSMRHFLSVFLLLFALSVQAQVGSPRNEWAVGLNGGWTLSRVTFTPTVRQVQHQAPTFGITARFTSEKYFALLAAVQMEVNYARLGWTEDIHSYIGNKLPDTYQRDIHYIQVPLLTSLALGKEQNGVKGFLLLGPQVGYAFADKEMRSEQWTTRTAQQTTVPDRTNDAYLQYGKSLDRRIDYGITAGLGLELGTGIGRFLLDARYYYGLADIFHNAKKDPFSRSAHATIMAKLTYLIDLKR